MKIFEKKWPEKKIGLPEAGHTTGLNLEKNAKSLLALCV